MTVDYMAPRYSQMYLGTTLIPIPADANAYSIGPAPEDTSLNIGWISYGYNFGGSVGMSQSTLIKDENDYFYYIASDDAGGVNHINVNVYDAPNSSGTVYAINFPAELEIIGTIGRWFIRKKSSTELDFVAQGTSVGGKGEVRHFLWTIGDASMTYVGGGEYDNPDLDFASILQGPLLIHAVYLDGATTARLITYNLDSSAWSDAELFDLTDISPTRLRVFHGGKYVYLIWSYGEVTATKDCDYGIGGIQTFNLTSRVMMAGRYYDLNGSSNSFSNQIAQQYGLFSEGITYIDYFYGVKPDIGKVFFRFHYNFSWSDDTDCPPVPIIAGPDLRKDVIGYYSLLEDGGAFSSQWTDEGAFGTTPTWPKNDLIDPGYWGDGWQTVYGGQGDLHCYPSRIDPTSWVGYSDEGDEGTYILHWSSLEATGQDAFTSIGNQGQEIDNDGPIYSTKEFNAVWKNHWWDSNGGSYLIQSKAGGTGDAGLPITGYFGRWPVHEENGRWCIFGPVTPIPPLARWFCV